MKVYVLVSNFTNVDSGGFETSTVGVFSEKKDAKKAMVEQFENIKEEFKYWDTDEEQDEMSCSIWEKGEYPSHHYDLLIQERKIQ